LHKQTQKEKQKKILLVVAEYSYFQEMNTTYTSQKNTNSFFSTFVFFFKFKKVVLLNPGKIGIHIVEDSGLILAVTSDAQESLTTVGIKRSCTILKIDEATYSHKLLQEKKIGDTQYEIIVSCPPYVTKSILFCICLL